MVLLQRRGPVKNGRVTFQKALTWLQHQKLKSILSDGILIHRGIWNQSGIEEFSWNAYLRRRAALHGCLHHFSFVIDEEEFPAVPAPLGLRAPGERNLLYVLKRRKRSNKDLPFASTVLAVSDQSPV